LKELVITRDISKINKKMVKENFILEIKTIFMKEIERKIYALEKENYSKMIF
jgi:hypothetical protein